MKDSSGIGLRSAPYMPEQGTGALDRGPITYLAIFALSIGAAMIVMRRREWTWIGLYIALGCLLASMSRHETWVRMAFDPDVFGKEQRELWLIPWTPTLPMALLALALGLMELFAALGALRRPSLASTSALFLTALYQLTSTAWNFGSWIFDGYGDVMVFGRAADTKLSEWLSLLLHTLLFDVPFVCAIPWGLSRFLQPRNTPADQVLERFTLITGFVLAVLAVLASAIFVAVLRVSQSAGHGSNSAQIYAGGSILLLIGLSVVAISSFRRTFLVPAMSIIEAINSEQPLDSSIKPGSIWEPVGRSVEETRSELRVARGQLQSFVENVPMALTITDLEGRHILVNPVAALHHGAAAELMAGADPEANFAGRPELEQYLEQGRLVAESKRSRTIEVTSHSAIDGVDKNVFVTFFPLFDSEGEVDRVGTIATDVTALREAERNLARSRDALHQNEKLAALGQLLAGVAHELNNPLAIVLGRASILDEKLAGTPHAESVGKLLDAADRCSRIVNTFLTLARQSGPQRGAVKLNEITESVVEMLDYGLRSANIATQLSLDPRLPEIEADGDQLIQVLINLVINAQHALEGLPGPRELTVSTRFDKAGKRAAIEVRDNGLGVPAEIAARIFEPFFTTKDVGEGTGLGLSVCRGMIEAHGGTLTYDGAAGGGAVFTVTLPVVSSSVPASAAKLCDPHKPKSEGRVLIVDDEPEIGTILAECLNAIGLECTVASDGRSALDLAGPSMFDMVFCDMRMPGMDGLTFLAELEQRQPELAKQLVFVSGDLLHRDVAAIEATGERPVIRKPFNPKQVREVAQAILAGDKS